MNSPDNSGIHICAAILILVALVVLGRAMGNQQLRACENNGGVAELFTTGGFNSCKYPHY